MAKAKVDFQKILLEKGDKIGLISGGTVMGLLILWGGFTALSSGSASEIANDFETQATAIKSKVSTGPGKAVVQLEEELVTPPKSVDIQPGSYHAKYAFFDLLEKGASKRLNPRLLPIVEAEAVVMRSPLKVNDIIEGTPPKVAVLKEKGKNANIGVAGMAKDFNAKQRQPVPAYKIVAFLQSGFTIAFLRDKYGVTDDEFKRAGVPAQMLAPPPGAPPGPAGPAGPAGAPPGAPPPPALAGGGGGRGGRGDLLGGAAEGTYDPNGQVNNIEQSVEYLGVDKVTSTTKLAEFILPQRMIVVNASFPYKAQLEEFRKALRYTTLPELMATSSDMLYFSGFDVERQGTHLGSGTKTPWVKVDYIANSLPLRTRTKYGVGTAEDEVKLKALLTYSYQLRVAMPLPKLARDKELYPSVTLPTIIKTADDFAKATTPPPNANAPGQLLGADDPFAAAGGANPMGGDGPRTLPGAPATDPGAPGAVAAERFIPDHVMVRFYDLAILPGVSYEYRIRMKAFNPNFGKKDQVAVPSFALEKEILGTWSASTKPISVPADAFLYALGNDTSSVRPANSPVNLDKSTVQVQTWFEQVRDGSRAEPVGDWVIANLEVTKGEYIGNKKRVELPLWSPGFGKYIIKEQPAAAGKPRQNGVDINFGSRAILVDFDGGKFKGPLPNNPKKTIDDESAVELLILSPDGKLRSRNSGTDKADDDRKTRETTWNKWVESARRNAPKTSTTTDDPFGAPRPPGG